MKGDDTGQRSVELHAAHGHHVVRGIFAPVNPARGAFTKAKDNIVIGHLHNPSHHNEVTMSGKVIGAWSLGCLCQLRPDYSPQTGNSQHGFAHVTIEPSGDFFFRNFKVVEKKKGENFHGPANIYPMQKAILEAKDQAAQLQVLGKFRDLITIKPKEVRRCIATFGPLDAEADVVKIYVRNLTGTVDVKIVDGKRVLEEYVLVLKYKIPGDEFGRGQDRFLFESKQWIKVPREMPTGRSVPDGGAK